MADNSKDLTLLPGQYAFISDESKGTLTVLVGPTQKSLGPAERPVLWDIARGNLSPCQTGSNPATPFTQVPQGYYAILNNPAQGDQEPPRGQATAALDLLMGRSVNVVGPKSFPLWPMQSVTVIRGHLLRTDQYVLVEVTDADQAKVNKDKGYTLRSTAVQTVTGGTSGSGGEQPPANAPEGAPPSVSFPTTLGERFLVMGTDVAFYIPPTGYQVVTDENGNHVRTAVSLENLEYCVLLDENGTRRIPIGPSVVFPKPSETFVTVDEATGSVKGRATELDPGKGIFVKVTKDYKEDDGTERKAGEELFITGDQQRIYFPRNEHTLISYGKQTIHYGVEIPLGDGRYVMDRQSGAITLVKGERLFLPDPRSQVIVRRVLSDKEVRLLFPGNDEALEINRSFRQQAGGKAILAVEPREVAPLMRASRASLHSFDRDVGYTPPRTITIDSKYEGAVRVRTFPGFAMMLVDGNGKKRIIKDGEVTLLEYSEQVHSFSLSTGTPKSDQRLAEYAYLQIMNNSVSDEITVETKDLCSVRLRVCCRVNFEGENPEKWFAVSDYVKLLSQNVRSMLRAAAKGYGVIEFQSRAPEIIRDVILGAKTADAARPGRRFDENAMRIYDVDVLDVTVEDPAIAELIAREQRAVFTHELTISGIKRDEALTKLREGAAQTSIDLKAATSKKQLDAEREKIELEAANKALTAKLEAEQELAAAEAEKSAGEIVALISEVRLGSQKAADEHATSVLKERTGISVEADKARLAAVSDKLAEAITNSAQSDLVVRALEKLNFPVVAGESLAVVMSRALSGTPLGENLSKMLGKFAPALPDAKPAQ